MTLNQMLSRFIGVSAFLLMVAALALSQGSSSSAITITGRVISNDGQPVPYATVGYTSATFGGPNLPATRTDENGSFTFKFAPNAPYQLTAFCPAYVQASAVYARARASDALRDASELGYFQPGDSPVLRMV